jgi:hypothetical protein
MTQESQRKIDPEAVKRIKAEMDSLRFATELRIKRARQRENCLLCLASALLRLKHGYGMTWEEIAEKVDGLADKGHAHKIARREAGLSAVTYRLATNSINMIFLANNDTTINFPDFNRIELSGEHSDGL